jgi:hypothetical protein
MLIWFIQDLFILDQNRGHWPTRSQAVPFRWPQCPPRRGRTTFSHIYLFPFQLILQTPPAAALAFTIRRRLISWSGAPQHTIKLSLSNPGKNFSCPLEPRRLTSTIKPCTPHRCTSSSNSTEFPRPQIHDLTFKHENHVSSCPRRSHLSGCT